jgi:hypothetical protein
MDKLGERLAFELGGARLYEALLSTHTAYGSFNGGPDSEGLLHILTQEYAHADLLERAIKDLGGDPTALTPAANLAANISAGLPQVLRVPTCCSASRRSWWPSWPTTSAGALWPSSSSRAAMRDWRSNAWRRSLPNGITCARCTRGSPPGRDARWSRGKGPRCRRE